MTGMERPGTSPGRRIPHRVRSVLSVVSLVVLSASVTLLVTLAALPRWSDWHLVTVVGGSMEPTIPLGSVAVIRPTSETIAVGTVIEYRSPETGLVTLHRVVGRDERDGHLVTRGDANNVADRTPVQAGAVTGEYAFHVPYAGRAAAWLRSPTGWIVAVLIPGALMIGIELRRLMGASSVPRRAPGPPPLPGTPAAGQASRHPGREARRE